MTTDKTITTSATRREPSDNFAEDTPLSRISMKKLCARLSSAPRKNPLLEICSQGVAMG